jgi:urease accessory protein
MILREKWKQDEPFEPGQRLQDWLPLHWHEAPRRLLHKQSRLGRDVSLRFPTTHERLQHEELLYADSDWCLFVEILPCPVIRLHPGNARSLAAACYEIGNRHLPLYYEEGLLLMPYDEPVYRQLQRAGFEVEMGEGRLLQPLRTTVAPHSGGAASLLEKFLHRKTETE